MPRGRELKLRVEDRPGMLGEIALALSERKVNIRAVNSWIEGNEAVVRLVVDQVGVAKKALAARGWKAEEQEILEVELADKPGALAALAGALGQAGVNITHAYGGTGGARKGSVFLAVSDLKAALKAAR